MKYAVAIVVAIAAIACAEVASLIGPGAALVLVACVISTAILTIVKGATMTAQAESDETLRIEGFGMKGEARGRRILSSNALLLVVGLALGLGLYLHHVENQSALNRIFESMAENTYVLSLSQADREKLNLRMPESLRRKLRVAE